MRKVLCCGLVTCCLAFSIACNFQGLGSGLDPEATNPARQPGNGDSGCDSTFNSISGMGPWFIGSPESQVSTSGSVMVMGLGGGSINEVAITLGAPSYRRCSLSGSELTTEFDSTSIHIVGASGSGTNRCALDLTATVDPCGQSVFLGFMTVDIFDLDSEGHATVDGEEVQLGPLQLTGVMPPEGVPCESWTDSLIGMTWELGTDHPLGLFTGGEGASPSIHLSGWDDSIEFAAAYEQLEDQPVGLPGVDPSLHCFGSFPQGAITFDGTNLTISTELESDERDDAQPCSVQYSGDVTSCELFAPYVGDSDEGPQQVIQIEGAGSVKAGDVELTFSSLYLSAMVRPVPTTELCDDDFAPLEEGDYWRIASRNPFARGPYAPAQVNMEGSGNQVIFFDGIPSGDPEDRGAYCLGPNPQGTFMNNGDELIIDVTSSDDFSSCSVNFDGVLASCETKIDDAVFYSDEEVRLLRFDGTGTMTVNGEASPISTLYFVRDRGDYGDFPAVIPPFPAPEEPTRAPPETPVAPPAVPAPAKP